MQQSTADSVSTIKSDTSFKEIVAFKFNSIRFPHYRIASKLRFLQKTSNFHLIDLFNTLEAFREFGLNGNPDLNSLVPNSQVFSLVDYLFVQLCQRTPVSKSQELNVQKSTELIYSWIVETFDLNQRGFTNILALKIALTLICSSTYSNKLRYLFTLLSNDGPFLIESHFDLYLRYILAVAQYFEDISIFFYDEDLHSSIFNFSSSINSTHFIYVLTNYENQADFTAWLIVYHRLADAELVTHQTSCSCCGQENFRGFRYKCKKCSNYNLCESCFWTGKHSGSHDPDQHPCKEYLFEKPKNHLRRSIRKSLRNSFRRSPNKQAPNLASQSGEDLTRKHLNLTNIIASPTHQRRILPSLHSREYRFHDIAVDNSDSISNLGPNEEHTLISHYLYLLKHKSQNETYDSLTSTEALNLKSFEKKIEQLEHKNRHLMQQIAHFKDSKSSGGSRARLTIGGSLNDSQTSSEKNVFLDELMGLRQKKDDLEDYLGTLQDRRKVLMVQLDNLMREFKDLDVNGNNAQQAMESLMGKFSNSLTTEPLQYSNHSEMDTRMDDHDLKSKAIISSLAFS